MPNQKPAIDPSAIEKFEMLQIPGEPSLLKEIIDLYFETADLDAKKLTESLNENDFKHLSEIAHGLKSSSANLGGLLLAEICQKLEDLGPVAKTPTSSALAADLLKSFHAEYKRVGDELRILRAKPD